jgi:hypothetical protein
VADSRSVSGRALFSAPRVHLAVMGSKMSQRTADSDDEEVIAATGVCETRKPYLRPQLVRLGTLADMTRKVGYRGSADGGRFPFGFRTAW